MYIKSKKAWCWTAFGALFLGYFLIESLFIGINFHSLLWCWAVCGVICILLGLVTFKYGKLPLPKWLFRTLVILIALAMAFFCFIEVLIISQMGAKGENGLDYIIVLGAKVNRNEVPSKPLYWRIDAAEKYLKQNPNTIAILSGGQGADEPISEAECMLRELTKRGISSGRLILESESRDTNQNIRNSLNLMPSDANFGVVSNNFHVYRAVRISEKISGKNVSGIASEYKDALLVHYMAREAVGIFFDVIEGNMTFFK